MLKERVIYGTLGFAAAVAVILQGSVAVLHNGNIPRTNSGL